MAERQGFLFYHDWITSLQKLPPDQAMHVLSALTEYSQTGERPQMENLAEEIMCDLLANQIDRDKEKYQAVCERNQQNGKRGGRPKSQNRPVSEKPTGFFKTQSNPEKPKKPDIDTDLDLDLDLDTDLDKKDTPPISPQGDDRPPECPAQAENLMVKTAGGAEKSVRHSKTLVQERFEKFWAEYPKKVGKKKAQDAFKRLKVDDQLLTRMLAALEWQKQCRQWTDEGGRYIPNPTTWLNQGRWDDEPAEGGSHNGGQELGSPSVRAGGAGTQNAPAPSGKYGNYY